MALTDYDRFPEDIDGEGDGFSLASKRTTTFMSAGMTLAESSPGREITDVKWRRSSPHEAPPTTGILLFITGAIAVGGTGPVHTAATGSSPRWKTWWGMGEVQTKASLDSPALTGTPTAPTPETTAAGIEIATAAFVAAKVA